MLALYDFWETLLELDFDSQSSDIVPIAFNDATGRFEIGNRLNAWFLVNKNSLHKKVQLPDILNVIFNTNYKTTTEFNSNGDFMYFTNKILQTMIVHSSIYYDTWHRYIPVYQNDKIVSMFVFDPRLVNYGGEFSLSVTGVNLLALTMEDKKRTYVNLGDMKQYLKNVSEGYYILAPIDASFEYLIQRYSDELSLQIKSVYTEGFEDFKVIKRWEEVI